MAEEILKWQLTEMEITKLKEFAFEDAGSQDLLKSLCRYLGEVQERKAALWESIKLTHNIPDDTPNIIANYEAGYIWVKGKVKEFDDKEKRVNG